MTFSLSFIFTRDSTLVFNRGYQPAWFRTSLKSQMGRGTSGGRFRLREMWKLPLIDSIEFVQEPFFIVWWEERRYYGVDAELEKFGHGES
jgi:hypothetical protein